MSHYLNQTAKVVLDKYKGDLDNLRKEAKHDPAKIREAVKAFKVSIVKERTTQETECLWILGGSLTKSSVACESSLMLQLNCFELLLGLQTNTTKSNRLQSVP